MSILIPHLASRYHLIIDDNKTGVSVARFFVNLGLGSWFHGTLPQTPAQISHVDKFLGITDAKTNGLAEALGDDLAAECFLLFGSVTDKSLSVQSIAERNLASVGPVEHTRVLIKLEVDGLGQTTEDDLDVVSG
ncbi:hypothetical protein KCV07_g527, partial [Aureobasidium melanogenum]